MASVDEKVVSENNASAGRRLSARLSGRKRPYYGSPLKPLAINGVDNKLNEEKKKVRPKSKVKVFDVGEKEVSAPVAPLPNGTVQAGGVENGELTEECSSQAQSENNTSAGKRVSARLSGRKMPYYGSPLKPLASNGVDNKLNEEKKRVRPKSKVKVFDVGEKEVSSPVAPLPNGTVQAGGVENGELTEECSSQAQSENNTSAGKRVSARLSGRKMPYYGSPLKPLASNGVDNKLNEEKKRVRPKSKVKVFDVGEKEVSSPVAPLPNGTVQAGGVENGELTEECSSQKQSENNASAGKRVSARLSGRKRPYYGSPRKPLASNGVDNKLNEEKKKVRLKSKVKVFDAGEKEVSAPLAPLPNGTVQAGGVENGELTESCAKDFTADASGKSAHVRVKETIRLFNKHYLNFIQLRSQKEEEEKRCKKRDDCVEDGKRSAKRPDLKAISQMIETNDILSPTKKFGHFPGVDVGHQFFSRAEMVAIGFHSHWLNGIDYMGAAYGKLKEYEGYTFPLAVSIVLSGMYEDDQDNSEEVVYTGQGGNNLLGDKRQMRDQVMLRGNLALKHNMEQLVPVRVIRGHECLGSYSGRVYTYDGLYKVTNYWAEKGASGFTVFKYRLKRLEGQPTLTTNQVHFVRAQAPRSISELRGLVCDDISGGLENIPIPATNLVDDPPFAPMGFSYYKSNQVDEDIELPAAASGCNCKGICIDPNICACAKLNGSDFPYVHKAGGRLIEAKAVVIECGPQCRCGPACVNRISQRGMKYRLEVFRTPSKGWAVRSWDFIPSGAPVCEYMGRLMKTNELENISENNFIFEIDCLQTMKGLDGRERRPGDVPLPTFNHQDKTDDQKAESVPEFCIDASKVGNVARFINHSCEPNLFVQCVLSSHHDIKLARIVLFAADNIPPLQELCYDYGYILDSVVCPDGKVKVMPCYCGAMECRKRLY